MSFVKFFSFFLNGYLGYRTFHLYEELNRCRGTTWDYNLLFYSHKIYFENLKQKYINNK